MKRERDTVAFIVPTGTGASIGGYAGDASFWARKFAEKFKLLVNPNTVNAACFSGITPNMFYTEGWAISQLFKGNISLIPSKNNKIGIIFDKAISEKIRNVHINTMNAVKTVYGTDIIGYEVTKDNAGVEFFTTQAKISSGSLTNPKTLLEAGKKLIKKGADAIAVVCKFDETPDDDYINGNDVDIVGGIEAIISHYLSSELFVPVAHAPAFENINITTRIVSPKAAAEYITPTFLPCILLGLQNAPLISHQFREQYICIKNIKSLVMPYNSLGSSVVLDAIKNKIPVFAIKENKTVLNVTKDSINKENDIIEISTYKKCLEELLKEKNNEKET